MRAVVETNVWISSVLNPTGRPGSVRQALVDRHFTLVTSEHLLAEIKEVPTRPRFSRRYKVAAADIEELTALLRERAEIAAVTELTVWWRLYKRDTVGVCLDNAVGVCHE